MNHERWLISAVILCCSSLSIADGIDQGKSFALERNQNQIVPLINNPDTSVVPNFNGANAPEQHYYGLGAGIEDEARAAAGSNPAAQFIYGSRASRPDVNLDRHNDPLFTHYEGVRDHATSLSETYTGCVDLPTGDPASTSGDLRTCPVTRSFRTERTECHTTYRPQCTNNEIYEEPITQDVVVIVAIEATDDYSAIVSVNFPTEQWTVVQDDGARGSADHFVQLTPLNLSNICSDYRTRFEYVDALPWLEAGQALGATTVNSQPLVDSTPGWSSTVSPVEHPSCSNGLTGLYQLGLSAELFASRSPHAIGAVFRYRVVSEEACPYELVVERDCPLPGSGTNPVLVSSTCVESGFRQIQGQSVYNDCWDHHEFWDVTLLGTDDTSACEALSDAGCSFQSRECLSHSQSGECLSETHTYACENPSGQRAVSLCGNQLICPDGQCTDDVGQDYETAEDQFADAAAGMSAAGETSEGFDPNLDSFFTGDPKRCTKKILNFADCCAADGWGLDIGLDICSTEEVELGYARQTDRALYVGRYTSGSLIDERKNYVYCTYPSKMARILVQQGKAQLGKNFGSARSPDCSGLSPDELTALDMNDMDFSSMFPDLLTQAMGNTPSGEDLQQLIIDKLQQMFPDN